jgi:hypothetical protein
MMSLYLWKPGYIVISRILNWGYVIIQFLEQTEIVFYLINLEVVVSSSQYIKGLDVLKYKL